ncbi:helicase-related protein [Oceanibaculum indicum]|uniref:ATP-dependent RNA helicase SUPV3L1/SUV3 n=1 Tax=Oceanibaculum indicum TaxID=526216 RepID=A0A420WAC4_9PROT|nr:helicase-related protein [Oceanibaculum indicum]RKQ67933.1 ATP-dependent RNA helicase SUPV3L1/SUV3 [Oceanibaculum indicum]
MTLHTSHPAQGGPRVTAVLGPTNTGKTYLAIERMLGHSTGMIGFPLRLLARENYDRIARIRGANQVALITGEEKIVPPHARYFVCTVESMPLDRRVSFLAVDEIQLCADRERGHVFTDRLLNARGLDETMFLGAETIRPLLKRLIPEAHFVTRPRFSTLSYTGYKKVTRLPRRSAVVAFSAADVYSLAELVRRQRGGTAVVLGALSPRARNAQVEMYQAGEVDYLVATDAIGMGLNMDLDHVAFARLGKFDGRGPRRLTAPELAQIAGRAGRHMSDGSFGVTAEVTGIEEELIEQIETHAFEPLKALTWRASRLDYRSVGSLRRSLEERPPQPFLMRQRDAGDMAALEILSRNEEVLSRAQNPATVRLLWEICQIPDFRKLLTDHHTALLARIFLQLTDGENGKLSQDWVAKQLEQIDTTLGDIETLVERIAHIRTWNYIAHRGDWIDDPAYWQERARGIEEKLSDALHDRLTQRFVDRRSAVLVKRLKDQDDLVAAVRADGEVLVEGHAIGRLEGLGFIVDDKAVGDEAKALRTAARRALAGEMPALVRKLEETSDTGFRLMPDGRIGWKREEGDEAAVGRLRRGDSMLKPRVEALGDDLLTPALRDRVEARLSAWLAATIGEALGPLVKALAEDSLSGTARGIVFQLGEGLGSLPAAPLAPVQKLLQEADRKALARLGVRFGTESVFFPALLKPKAVALRAVLWSVHEQARPIPHPPPPGRVSVPAEELEAPEGFVPAIGYIAVGPRLLRLDMAERIAATARRLLRAGEGSFLPSAEIMSLAGCTAEELPALLAALGYRTVEQKAEDGTITVVFRKAQHRPKGGAKNKPKRKPRAKPQEQVANQQATSPEQGQPEEKRARKGRGRAEKKSVPEEKNERQDRPDRRHQPKPASRQPAAAKRPQAFDSPFAVLKDLLRK